MSAQPRALTALLIIGLCGTGLACHKGAEKDAAMIELRPVVASNPGPCPKKAPHKDEIVRPLTTDNKTECLELGKPIVDAKDVRSATTAQDPSGAPALSLVLGSVGGANLDGFAGRNLGKRLAILADGAVVNAPTVNYSSFAGRIQVSGLSGDKTADLFRRLNEMIKKG
ncbi:MAG TPA: hypothetical protein VHL53_05055 [Acidimicrobiia bacterium]|nr:hypothetical protein [Acidimicrobiia bacterium]